MDNLEFEDIENIFTNAMIVFEIFQSFNENEIKTLNKFYQFCDEFQKKKLIESYPLLVEVLEIK